MTKKRKLMRPGYQFTITASDLVTRIFSFFLEQKAFEIKEKLTNFQTKLRNIQNKCVGDTQSAMRCIPGYTHEDNNIL